VSQRIGTVAAVAAALWVSVAMADTTLEVRVEPPRFGIEDSARVVVRVHDPSDDVSPPELGELTNLQVVAGPSRGHEFSFVNGVSTTTVSFTYAVRAEEVGEASLGPVTVTVGDVQLSEGPISMEVAPGSLQPPRNRRRSSSFPSDPFTDIFGRRPPPQAANVVLRHFVRPQRIVLGQPVTATVVLDTTAAVDDFGWGDAPGYPGWWAQRVDPPEQITPEPVEVDGVRFNRFTIARHALIPLKTGELVIPPVSARIGTRTRGFIDPGQVVDRSTPEITVTVEDRPGGPVGYAGAVGQLRYAATLDPETIAFGESAVLTVTLTGRGNLPMVESPSIWPSCEGCETYPPEESSAVTVDASGIHGSRSWRLTVVPRTWGELQLEPVEMAVFDPSGGVFKTQTLGPLKLVVEPPPATPTPVVATAPAAESAEAPVEALPDDEMYEIGGRWIWPVAALGIGILFGGGVTWFVGRRKKAALPPRMPDQSPADRARELQLALERWWLDIRAKGDKKGLQPKMEALRKDLEAVRFAPGRADHSETIEDLEDRLRELIRKR
jgi:hypothetical protein